MIIKLPYPSKCKATSLYLNKHRYSCIQTLNLTYDHVCICLVWIWKQFQYFEFFLVPGIISYILKMSNLSMKGRICCFGGHVFQNFKLLIHFCILNFVILVLSNFMKEKTRLMKFNQQSLSTITVESLERSTSCLL